MSRPGLQRRPSALAAANKTIILVTSASSGVGLEIVKRLALESSAIQILLGCRETEKGEAAVASMGAPTNVNPIQLDITDDKSIQQCFLAISQIFGKLDILISNADTVGGELPEGSSLRSQFDSCYSVNVTSAAVLTEVLTPLLENSPLAKVIFLSSSHGGIQKTVQAEKLIQMPFYGASKSALNYLTVYYAKKYPKWKVNAFCPGPFAADSKGSDAVEETFSIHDVARVAELVAEKEDGVSGTFSNAEGSLAW